MFKRLLQTCKMQCRYYKKSLTKYCINKFDQLLMNDKRDDAYERELREDAYWDMKRKGDTVFRLAIFVFLVIFIIVIAIFLKVISLTW